MYLDVPARKLGSMVWINGLFHLLIHGVYCGFYQHFQQDIQVGRAGRGPWIFGTRMGGYGY